MAVTYEKMMENARATHPSTCLCNACIDARPPLPEGPALNVRREIKEGSYEAHMICEHCGNGHWRGCMADAVTNAIEAGANAIIRVPGCTSAKEFGERINEARKMVGVARGGLANPQTVETGKMFPTPIKSDEQIAKDKAKVSKKRKDTPVYSGAMAYFPLALAAVAQLSKAGNDKHNPGQPLHWSRGKSNDHADCIARHLLELGTVDPDDGFLHDVKLAWRALANLQIRLESSK